MSLRLELIFLQCACGDKAAFLHTVVNCGTILWDPIIHPRSVAGDTGLWTAGLLANHVIRATWFG